MAIAAAGCADDAGLVGHRGVSVGAVDGVDDAGHVEASECNARGAVGVDPGAGPDSAFRGRDFLLVQGGEHALAAPPRPAQQQQPMQRWAGIQAVRGQKQLVCEAKGHTSEKGIETDTAYGQLQRRMTRQDPHTRSSCRPRRSRPPAPRPRPRPATAVHRRVRGDGRRPGTPADRVEAVVAAEDDFAVGVAHVVAQVDRGDRGGEAGFGADEGGIHLLSNISKAHPAISKAWADKGYRMKAIDHGARLCIDMEVLRRDPAEKGFKVIPRRRVAERTFGWLMRHRRLARDHETHPHRSEALINIAVIDLMNRRLTRESTPNWRGS
ncbi:hypothetical protein [Streptomyces sp. NPDC060035]|uniref:hypothetical protein n=1 Tax=Streptomyces sp. NPDC060035 TaxID=3347044 RepID=UPI0036973240